MIDNLFCSDSLAERYEDSRPYFQPLVIDRVRKLIGDHRTLVSSLDAGCGTGQSTRALSSISNQVVGMDASAAMLRVARRLSIHPFVHGVAEALPFLPASFELVSAGLAFHWFDRIAFLRESRRVLRPKGWLLTFNDGFSGIMRKNTAFADWNRLHLERFPSPPRASQPLPVEVIRACGFRVSSTERFSHAERYSLDNLIAYLFTQTNITAAIQEGRETDKSVTAYLKDSLGPLFVSEQGTFEFGGSFTLYEALDCE